MISNWNCSKKNRRYQAIFKIKRETFIMKINLGIKSTWPPRPWPTQTSPTRSIRGGSTSSTSRWSTSGSAVSGTASSTVGPPSTTRGWRWSRRTCATRPRTRSGTSRITTAPRCGSTRRQVSNIQWGAYQMRRTSAKRSYNLWLLFLYLDDFFKYSKKYNN